jgi:hypothetical protein
MRRVQDLRAPTVVRIGLVGREGDGLAGPQQVRWRADETRLGEGTMPELERTFRAARFPL